MLEFYLYICFPSMLIPNFDIAGDSSQVTEDLAAISL